MNKMESERLYFRKITKEDTEMVLQWRNSNSVRANFIYQPIITVEEHLNWLKTKVETGKVIQLIIIEKENDLPIGSVYLRDIDYGNLKAEYGIFIGEESARGKGYGIETAKRIMLYAFDELKLHKLSLRALEKNNRSIKANEKAGFRIEGKMIDEVLINGQFQNLIFMAAIAENEK